MGWVLNARRGNDSPDSWSTLQRSGREWNLGNGNWIRGGCIAAAIFMAALLLLGAHDIGKINNVPHWFHKVEHFFYYGIMALLLAHGLGRRWFWLALFLVPLVGALDELHQIYVPRRSASAWDWATDAVAAAIAVYLYHRWTTAERSELVRGKS